MNQKDIDEKLAQSAFVFFYRFSRFEFALKENGILKNEGIGYRAEPGWNKFVARFASEYELTKAAGDLIAASPKTQVVGRWCALVWSEVPIDGGVSDLARTVRLLQTVRNNLFHGGKSGAEGWDDPERTAHLLSLGAAILDELANLGGLLPDYQGVY